MRRVLLAALCVLAACSKSPSAPSSPQPGAPLPPPAQFAGYWSIDYRVSTCDGRTICAFMKGTTLTADLRLIQQGLAVRGLFVGFDTVNAVSGTVQPDGSLTLTGLASPPVGAAKPSSARIELHFAPEGALQGTLLADTSPLPEYAEYPTIARVGGDITAAQHGDLAAFVSDLDGKWSGKFTVRSCTPVVTGHSCYPVSEQHSELLDLTLSRGAAGLSGTFDSAGPPVAVAGTSGGPTVHVSGELLDTSSGGSGLTRVNLNATVDEFGRMNGTFTYDFVFPVAKPDLGGVATAELWQMVKRR